MFLILFRKVSPVKKSGGDVAELSSAIIIIFSAQKQLLSSLSLLFEWEVRKNDNGCFDPYPDGAGLLCSCLTFLKQLVLLKGHEYYYFTPYFWFYYSWGLVSSRLRNFVASSMYLNYILVFFFFLENYIILVLYFHFLNFFNHKLTSNLVSVYDNWSTTLYYSRIF